MSCRGKIRGVCELLSCGSWTNSKPLWGLCCRYIEIKKKKIVTIYDSRKLQSVKLSVGLVEIHCIIVYWFPFCKVEYVDKISRRKCILLNLYGYKWILFTVKYVIDAIYFIREVTLTYLPHFTPVPQSQTLFIYWMEINYIMVYWITIIQMGKCM